MMWSCSRSALGWIVEYKTPYGLIWFYPDNYGHVRKFFSTATGLSLDMQELAVVTAKVKAQFPGKQIGRRHGPMRGEFCESLAAALNEAKLFPARKVAA